MLGAEITFARVLDSWAERNANNSRVCPTKLRRQIQRPLRQGACQRLCIQMLAPAPRVAPLQKSRDSAGKRAVDPL